MRNEDADYLNQDCCWLKTALMITAISLNTHVPLRIEKVTLATGHGVSMTALPPKKDILLELNSFDQVLLPGGREKNIMLKSIFVKTLT